MRWFIFVKCFLKYSFYYLVTILCVTPYPTLVIGESLLSSDLASLGLRCKREVIDALREGRLGRLKLHS
jgi:hypothetical protein